MLTMLWTRLGSFNALEQTRPGGPWQKWIGGPLPSADALGDAAEALSLGDLRDRLFDQYTILKRNKAIRPLPRGFLPLILDAHESGASFLRQAPDALQRTLHTAKGDRLQFYFRHVAAMLRHAGGELLLDVEAIRPGEDEIAAAERLFERVVGRYPRAFDVVGGDALYLHPDFCRLVRRHHKHFIAVLKNENRNLITDARSLFGLVEPHRWNDGETDIQAWDISKLTTWPQYDQAVRVVRTLETSRVRRQRTRALDTREVEWMWATSLPDWKAPCEVLVRLGHGRWAIENQGFNEIVNSWHADHIYRNGLHAIAVLYLLLFFAYNLFHTFLTRGLKPELRWSYTMAYLAEKVRADFLNAIPLRVRLRPP